MASIVRYSSIVAQEIHGIVVGNVPGMFFHEGLHAIPNGRNRFLVLEQAQDEAVFLLVVGHELEDVVIDVAKELDARLDAPVPLVFEHQGLPKEEAGFKSAHVSVADGVSVYDFTLRHIFANFCGPILIDPFRK
jgi:hypothetical protein